MYTTRYFVEPAGDVWGASGADLGLTWGHLGPPWATWGLKWHMYVTFVRSADFIFPPKGALIEPAHLQRLQHNSAIPLRATSR